MVDQKGKVLPSAGAGRMEPSTNDSRNDPIDTLFLSERSLDLNHVGFD